MKSLPTFARPWFVALFVLWLSLAVKAGAPPRLPALLTDPNEHKAWLALGACAVLMVLMTLRGSLKQNAAALPRTAGTFTLASLATTVLVSVAARWEPSWRDDFGSLTPSLVVQEAILGYRFTFLVLVWLGSIQLLSWSRNREVAKHDRPVAWLSSLPIATWGLEATHNQWLNFNSHFHDIGVYVLLGWQQMAACATSFIVCALGAMALRTFELTSPRRTGGGTDPKWLLTIASAAVVASWLGYLNIIERSWMSSVQELLQRSAI